VERSTFQRGACKRCRVQSVHLFRTILPALVSIGYVHWVDLCVRFDDLSFGKSAELHDDSRVGNW
jgi:hypothetical protein